jgi:alpha-beta hydrolase superfamily lysophospholipase
MHEASASTLSTYTASDGENLAVQDWPLPDGTQPRGLVLLVHGLGEHAGRYDHVAERLNAWGYAVRGYDQYGHGESGGPRGGLTTRTRLVDDLADLVANARQRQPGVPIIVLGHSMGGLVAALFALDNPGQLEGLVLSSPALGTRVQGVQKLLLRTLPHVLPNLRVGNGLDSQFLSHDPAVVQAYRNDPRVHDRISARLAAFLTGEGSRVVGQAPHWRVPTLLLYAGQDQLVDPAGSRRFAQRAPSSAVTARCFEPLYHEIFNELDAQPVFDALRSWLDARF